MPQFAAGQCLKPETHKLLPSIIKHAFLNSTSRVSDSIDLGMSLVIYISNKFPSGCLSYRKSRFTVLINLTFLNKPVYICTILEFVTFRIICRLSS